MIDQIDILAMPLAIEQNVTIADDRLATGGVMEIIICFLGIAAFRLNLTSLINVDFLVNYQLLKLKLDATQDQEQKERASKQASKENMILTGTQEIISIVEHLDAFKVENFALILGGKFSFPKANHLKYFRFIFPRKPKKH